MCVFLYDVKVNSNHGVRLKTGMSFFIRPPLFLCYPNINLNYRVGVKKTRPKNFTEIRIKIPKLKSFSIKTNFRCYTNYIWKFFVNVKQERFTLRFGLFFSLLKAQKLPFDNNISFINATNIQRKMSVTDTNKNTP